jgi:muconolactone delta-isomerase
MRCEARGRERNRRGKWLHAWKLEGNLAVLEYAAQNVDSKWSRWIPVGSQ